MSEIDWSKAPEGATHARDCGWGNPDWYKIVDGVLMVHSSNDGWDESGYSDMGEVPNLQTRPAKAWTGTGLPPVGAVCEIQHESLGWTRCEIVAHKVMDSTGVTMAIAWIDANTLDQSQGIRFRPIRTQAQIEAEKRERAIDEMYAIVREGIYDKYALCSELYDAGYRKQGEGK